MKPKIITDADLRDGIAQDFGHHGGGEKLARKLAVTPFTACALRRGGGSLVKVAALYGYVAGGEPGTWKLSGRWIRPKDVGYKTWTSEIKADVQKRLRAGERLKDIAAAHKVTPKQLRDAIRRHRLRGDEDGERRLRAEQSARAAGGTMSEQLAHMQHALMSDEDRKRWNDELQELIDAAA